MAPDVGIVIPAYRPDPATLTTYVSALHETVEPTTIRIELDAPTDSTLDALAALPVSCGTASARRGKGAAITAGFEALDTDVLAFVDADGSTAPPSVNELVTAIDEAKPDVAVGSRHLPEATVTTHPPRARRVMSTGFVHLARLTTGLALTDFQCGAKAFTRPAWIRIRRHLVEPGFGWDLDALYWADREDCHLIEVPLTWGDEPGSTVSPISTAMTLTGVLGRIVRTRIRGHDRLRPGENLLVDRVATEAVSP